MGKHALFEYILGHNGDNDGVGLHVLETVGAGVTARKRLLAREAFLRAYMQSTKMVSIVPGGCEPKCT